MTSGDKPYPSNLFANFMYGTAKAAQKKAEYKPQIIAGRNSRVNRLYKQPSSPF